MHCSGELRAVGVHMPANVHKYASMQCNSCAENALYFRMLHRHAHCHANLRKPKFSISRLFKNNIVYLRMATYRA
jgi:hypothetical protein